MGFRELVRIFLGNHNGNGHGNGGDTEGRSGRDDPNGVPLPERDSEHRGGLNEVRTWP